MTLLQLNLTKSVPTVHEKLVAYLSQHTFQGGRENKEKCSEIN